MLQNDETETVDANEEVKKPGAKDDAILAFNTCTDWTTRNNTPSQVLLLLLQI